MSRAMGPRPVLSRLILTMAVGSGSFVTIADARGTKRNRQRRLMKTSRSICGTERRPGGDFNNRSVRSDPEVRQDLKRTRRQKGEFTWQLPLFTPTLPISKNPFDGVYCGGHC